MPQSATHDANRPLLGGPAGWVRRADAAAVKTATFTVAEADPLSVTELGVIVHFDCAGASLQLNFMLWLNSLSAVTVTE